MAKTLKNEFGVVPGDYFSMTWGYDQTNVNYFQVVSVTAKGVRVREVHPDYSIENATGPMSEDRVYKLEKKMLEYKETSHFIENQERGDLKKISTLGGGIEIYIKNDYHYIARLCEEDKETVYASWYA